METKNLKELIDFMDEHDLCELEIEEEGTRIKLKKSQGQAPIVIKENTATRAQEQTEEEPKNKGFLEVKSPMVGTFYHAASPGEKPYIEVNDAIKAGDVTCIIEAMKLMNEIKSEIDGTVVEILIENGEPVEFGQTMFLVKPQ